MRLDCGPRDVLLLVQLGRGWRRRWDAQPGSYVLSSRASDAAGNEQPLEPAWNVGGYANNAVQAVPVTVVDQ